MAVEKQAYREAMARLGAAVNVITTDGPGGRAGFTASAVCSVTDTPPTLAGATATNQYKEATLETGLKVNVPPFVKPGERIRIDTRTGEYLERAK